MKYSRFTVHTRLTKLEKQLAMACISTPTSSLKDDSHSLCRPGTAECPVKSLLRSTAYVTRISIRKYCYFCTYGFNAPFLKKKIARRMRVTGIHCRGHNSASEPIWDLLLGRLHSMLNSARDDTKIADF